MTESLIATARRLAQVHRTRPRQADLKRAVSTAYYALFHALARDCADRLIGVSSTRSDGAWSQVYRALDHGFAKRACAEVRGLGFPVEVIAVADAFARLQEERHRADYDPEARYGQAEVILLVSQADRAIKALRTAPARDCKAFAALVLLKRRPA